MRRPLTQLERILWKSSSYFQSIGAFTVRIRGAFSVDQLHAALARLRTRHPLLAVHVGEQHRWGASFLSEGTPDFAVRVVEACADDAWPAVVEEEIMRPFSFDVGPLMRFVLLRGAGFSDLVIVANHAIGDGLASSCLVREILQQLGDPAAAGAPPAAVPPMEALLPPPSSSGLRPRRSPRLKPARGLAPSDRAGRLAVLTWSLSELETAALCARSRAERTTVYAAVCAAFLRVFAELDTSSPVRRIETPVNLRDRLTQPIGEAMGNYISLAETAIDCATERDLWKLARTFKQHLNQEMAGDALFSRWRQLKRFAAVVPNTVLGWLLPLTMFPVKITYDLSVTNLGRWNIPASYGALQLESVHAPSLSPSAENHRFLAMIMFGERLSFSLTTRDRPLAQELQQRAMRHLRQALI